MQTKVCRKCGTTRSWDEFYKRSGIIEPTEEGHLLSECKECIKNRSKNQNKAYLDKLTPRAQSEKLAMDVLMSQGIPTVPGKAMGFYDTDLVAYGCVRIEVKYAQPKGVLQDEFVFGFTPKQQVSGVLADIILLIMQYPDEDPMVYVFDAYDPIFYINTDTRRLRMKSGLNYTVGRVEQQKHHNTRVALTEPMLEQAYEDWGLIWNLFGSLMQEFMDGLTIQEHASHRTLDN